MNEKQIDNWYRNKRIVLTGATSGIGKLLLMQLVNRGAKVIAAGRKTEHLPTHENIIPFRCDVSSPENLDELFAYAKELWGGVDLFFANAGFAYCEELKTPDWNHLDAIYRTNVYAPVYGLEKMMELSAGSPFSYVITASEVARTPLAGFSLYTSTKCAVSGFARTMQLEIPDHVRLTTIYPVAMKTDFFTRSGNDVPLPIFQQTPETTVRAIVRGVAAGKKEIHPSTIFNLAFYLLSLCPPFQRWALKISTRPFKKWLRR